MSTAEEQQLAQLYRTRRTPEFVDVPELAFLMIDGHGDPNVSDTYRGGAVRRCAASYGAQVARQARGRAWTIAVMPLEGLWWAVDMVGVLDRRQVGVGLDDDDHAAG